MKNWQIHLPVQDCPNSACTVYVASAATKLQTTFYSAITVSVAALIYSPVDFTDASDLHQTVVKFIG